MNTARLEAELPRSYRSGMPNVLIVEDEDSILELIAVNLEHAGQVAWRARSVEEAEKAINSALPDVVLLDWMLPGESGLAFARRLRADRRTKGIPIIMLTARVDERDKIIGLEAGADDYVTKPFSPKELVARIRAVLRRRAPELADEVVQIEDLSLDPLSHRVTGRGTKIDLGPTEFRLLHFFMTHPDRIYSRAQVLDEVWGDHVFVEERTVDVHIRRLRQALTATWHDRLIATVRGSGYGLRTN